MGRNSKKTTLYSLVFVICTLFTCEISIAAFELTGIIYEPVEWGERNNIPKKFNDCLKLFNQNPGKKRVVVVGNSQPLFAFNPYSFDEFFDHVTITYNLGIGGTAISFQSFFINYMIIDRLKPDFIIWDLHYASFFEFFNAREHKDETTHNDYNILDMLLPRMHTGNMNGLSENELAKIFLLKHFMMYKYRTIIPDRIGSLLIKDNTRGQVVSNDCELEETFSGFKNTTIQNHTYFPEAGHLFTSTLNRLEQLGIEFLVIYGPFPFDIITYHPVDVLFDTISPNNFLSFNGDLDFTDNTLYVDYLHLNLNGSQVYMNHVLEKINNSNYSTFDDQ
ncbi:hypothetical protein GF325_10805 [Candidatus Bathyarchaeota archaeon]|nr:hypothetical protein [Candidatus Bathyarchaeota archaeon]